MTQTISLTSVSFFSEETGYEFYLAVSSDSLCILNKDWSLNSWVIEGKDNSALVCQAEDEDSFLDAITEIKSILVSGRNPLCILNIYL